MGKHSKATEEQLSELHGELAQFFKQKLRGGDATAADLGQIRQFLKDNPEIADEIDAKIRAELMPEKAPKAAPEAPEAPAVD